MRSGVRGRGDALRRAGAAVALAVLATACSSDKQVEDTIPLPAPTTSTSAAVTTTSTPASPSMTTTASTAQVTTNTFAPTVPVSTPEPSTTAMPAAPDTTELLPDPRAAIEVDLRALYSADQEAYKTCLLQLPSCDVSVFASYQTAPSLPILQSRITALNAQGIHARGVDTFVYAVKSVDVHGDLQAAELSACLENTVVQYTVGENGDEMIVDAAFGSRLETWVARRGADGVWKLASGATVRSASDGSRVCNVSS